MLRGLISSLFLWQSNLVIADDSIWYRTDDPLNTEALTPPKIPEGYLDSTCPVSYTHLAANIHLSALNMTSAINYIATQWS